MKLLNTLLRLLLIGSLANFCSGALAQSYFQAEVLVKSQSRADRAEAAKQGLVDVLVRLSGSRELRENEAVKRASTKAISYVDAFQYAVLEDSELEAEGYNSVLSLSFSPRLVRKILSESELTFWSVNRPNTLVWLVEDSLEQGKQIVGDSSENRVIAGLHTAARARGVPLAFPLGDFEDQMAVGVQRLWEFDETAILAASERYGADIVLVGKYTQTSSGEIWSNWQFFHKQTSRVYDLRSEFGEQIGEAAVQPLADFLAGHYAVHLSPDEQEYIVLDVNDVRSFADYRGLMALLKKVDAVREFSLDTASDGYLRVQLQSEAGPEQLASILGLNKQLFVLDPVNQNDLPLWQRAPLGSAINPMRYRWVR